MQLSFTEKKNIRKNFGKLKESLSIPNLIEVQKNSYKELTEYKPDAEQHLIKGFNRVFKSIFPIEDLNDKATLEYISYRLEKPKFDVEECISRGLTYSAALKCILRLVVYEIDQENNTKDILSAKEQEVYMGEVPMMTNSATFITNGVQRVVVNQMHRSPGVFFDHDKGKSHASGKLLFNCRVIPNRGSWLDFEFDVKDFLYFKIDRKKKILVTTLLQALGYSKNDIVNEFYKKENYVYDTKIQKWKTKFDPENYKAKNFSEEIINAKNNKVVVKIGEKINFLTAKKLANEGLKEIYVSNESIYGMYLHKDIVIGEEKFKIGTELNESILQKFIESNILTLEISITNSISKGPYLLQTLLNDRNENKSDAITEIYKVLRPGEPPTMEIASLIFNNLFFSSDRYDLSDVGRVKMNSRLNLNCSDKITILRNDDIIAIVKKMLELRDGKDEVDDIDHLGNRRVRSVGELVENQARIGVYRMERAIKEKMTTLDVESAMPQDLINAKPLTIALKDFFATSQLSQFMDQTNPLSEITHKRRVSALGPGGLTRERAGFEVRDVHPTHYGRICPIETPEGPNIGLINSLATYAKINKYGFIESPYKKVKDAVVQDIIEYLSAMEETKYTIAQANSVIDKNGKLEEELVSCRQNLNFILSKPENIDYIDVSPKQLVSVAASLIPFLENDDANRALMGSNMQRQAVPLISPQAPIVGTGMEKIVARDSGQVQISKSDGLVISSTGIEIQIMDKENKIEKYPLQKYVRSNQGTTISQRSIVSKGDIVSKGQILCDSSSTESGNLALGQNILCAFMSWDGYNFEDAIILSDRLVKCDTYTSIHIEKLEIEARDTKLGPEEITADIPNIGEEALKNLDEEGIVRIGAEVGPGDILAGKITPKGETELSAEEKLLRAIFGEKARDVKDTSLRVPHGQRGKVIDVKILDSKEVKDLPPGVNRQVRVWIAQTRKISEGDKMAGRHGNKGVVAKILPQEDMPYLEDGTPVDIILNPIGVPSRMNLGQVLELHLGWAAKALGMKSANSPVFESFTDKEIEEALLKAWVIRKSGALDDSIDDHLSYQQTNYDRLYEWLKLKNKENLMGFFTDTDKKTPSSINIQEECLRLWFEEEINENVSECSIDELKEKVDELNKLNKFSSPNFGKEKLYDGRTGELFDQPIAVGFMYMLKLIHMVEDKIHARSTGPYSLITQQPLGGKAQFGGQRFGEMEVWALEAYSAAHNLQEILTIKSDDVAGRTKVYESIVKGDNNFESGTPESFNVMVKELRSLCLNLELKENPKKIVN